MKKHLTLAAIVILFAAIGTLVINPGSSLAQASPCDPRFQHCS